MQKMIGKLARTYPLLIVMGIMIVAAAFIIGLFNAQSAAAYYSAPKAIREANLTAQRAAIESTGLWLPSFKFLGLGLILGGIVMALRVIIDRLRAVGDNVVANLPPSERPQMPAPPWYGLLMPMVMMLGEVVFVVALAVGVRLAGIARQLYSHPVPEIDAAGPGSVLLAQFQSIQAATAWLVPLKFAGVATEFLAIVMGLATIIYLLNAQTHVLDDALRTAKRLVSNEGPSPAESQKARV